MEQNSNVSLIIKLLQETGYPLKAGQLLKTEGYE